MALENVAVPEMRAVRNGVPMPIQCLQMQLSPSVPGRPAPAPHLHYHDYTELLYGLDGSALVCIGKHTYPLAAGDLILIHPSEPHDVRNEEAAPCTYIVVKFLPQILLAEEQTRSEYRYALLLMQNGVGRQMFFPACETRGTDLHRLFLGMMAEWNGQRFGYELSLRADVTRVFLYILRAWWESNPPPAEEEAGPGSLIGCALSYIGAHYADLDEETVAAVCGVSRSYFSRSFKRVMGIGFTAYVNRVRMREAEKLLLTTDLSVTDIAETVGFSTAAYFIGQFRRLHRVTPRRYRAGM